MKMMQRMTRYAKVAEIKETGCGRVGAGGGAAAVIAAGSGSLLKPH